MRETAVARECLARGDKKRALLALRKKKYEETRLAQLDQQLANLERLIGDVEFSLVQRDVIFGLQQGTEVLREMQREMGGVEGVERLMADTEDARAYQEEISDLLGNKMSNQDEEDVEDELEELRREVEGEDVPKEQVALPSAPDTELQGAKTPGERARDRARVRAREMQAEAADEPIAA